LNASLFVTIWLAVIGSFLTIDARMGRVMKRGVLQNTGPCLQAHYSLGLHAGYIFPYFPSKKHDKNRRNLNEK
jgi:hypothetical protein